MEEVDDDESKGLQCSAKNKWPAEPSYRRVRMFRDGVLAYYDKPTKEFTIIQYFSFGEL